MEFSKWLSDLLYGSEETAEEPSMKWKKREIKSWMDKQNVKYNSGDTKKDLLDKIKWNQ